MQKTEQQKDENALRISSAPGTYILILRLEEAHSLQVGRLGQFELGAGHYAYVGSAFGAGGLRGRLKHHLAISSHPHWHVDYLRQVAVLKEVWLLACSVRREHEWAALLGRMPEAKIVIPRFGASDCSCPGHLYAFAERPAADRFQKRAEAAFPNDAAITCIVL